MTCLIFIDTFRTVKGLAEVLEVTPSTVRSWIRRGSLVAEKRGAQYLIPHVANADFVLKKLKEKHGRPRSPFIPKEIEAYEKWHTVLDEFCWLLKVTYATREDIKARKFRLDALLAAYLEPNIKKVVKIGKLLGSDPSRKSIVSGDLRRGWYNELFFSVPLKPSTLGLSFSDIQSNHESSDDRFTFPSWRIVSSYYACYFYLRGLTIQKEPAVNVHRHDATINAFKFNVVPVLSSNLWAFPMDISWTPKTRIFRRQLPLQSLPHLKYGYAAHPRVPNRLPIESFEFVYDQFRRRAKKRKNPVKYPLLDFLREFRVWANYIDIDNLLSLWGTGYRAFLDQNLTTITFFLAGISEFGFLAVRGPDEYLRELQSFYDGFICNNSTLESSFVNTPMYQRMIILFRLGLIDRKIQLRRHIDINSVSL